MLVYSLSSTDHDSSTGEWRHYSQTQTIHREIAGSYHDEVPWSTGEKIRKPACLFTAKNHLFLYGQFHHR